VNCGTTRIIGERNGRPVLSAIEKSPVDSVTVFFGSLCIEGDVQTNHKVHGGPDQAVCAYSADHWPWWREERNFDCAEGSFGENLTVLGADEDSLGIGDRFQWGDVVLEVTQPRGPCANVDLRHGRSDLAQIMTQSVRCGWYMRVVREGTAPARDAMIACTKPEDRPSIRDAFAARYDTRLPPSFRQGVRDHPALGIRWRQAIARTFA